MRRISLYRLLFATRHRLGVGRGLYGDGGIVIIPQVSVYLHGTFIGRVLGIVPFLVENVFVDKAIVAEPNVDFSFVNCIKCVLVLAGSQ